MNDALHHEFQQIARRALDEAGSVKCSLNEYAGGLDVMAEELMNALTAAQEDIEAQDKRENDKPED